MTIPASQPLYSGPYTGDAVATSFAYGFTIYAPTELIVKQLGADGVTETLLALTTDYTVVPAGGLYPAAGTITTAVPPPVGAKLTIEPDITRSQDRPFSNQGSISLKEIEDALDKVTSLARQLIQLTDRTLSVSTFETGDIVLPLSVPDKFLGWNAAGDALENKTPNAGDFITLPPTMTDGELMRNDGTAPGTFQNSGVVIGDDMSISYGDDTKFGPVGADFIFDVDPDNDNASSAFQAKVDGSNALRVTSAGAVMGTGSADRALRLSRTDAVKLPAGTTAQRPGAPEVGDIRYSSSLGGFEGYDVGGWRSIGKAPTRTVIASGSGTYTPPTGCRAIRVRGVGGGGGGGGADGQGASTAVASLGAAGAGWFDLTLSALAGSYSYAIGAGGTAGAATGGNGGNGGNTTFGDGTDTATANGSTGGVGGTGTAGYAIVGPQGPAAGAVTAGWAAKAVLGAGKPSSGTTIIGGLAASVSASGGSLLGGGAGVAAHENGSAATTPGTGGPGVVSTNVTNNYSGGAGAPGVLIIDEFY